jgi:hypothetical protein
MKDRDVLDSLALAVHKQTESISTINHHTESIDKAVNKIADAIDRMENIMASGFATGKAERAEFRNLLKWVVITSLIILAAYGGIKIAFP